MIQKNLYVICFFVHHDYGKVYIYYNHKMIAVHNVTGRKSRMMFLLIMHSYLFIESAKLCVSYLPSEGSSDNRLNDKEPLS